MLPTLTVGRAHTRDREWSVHQKLTSELRVIDEFSPTDSSPTLKQIRPTSRMAAVKLRNFR